MYKNPAGLKNTFYFCLYKKSRLRYITQIFILQYITIKFLIFYLILKSHKNETRIIVKLNLR